MDLNPERVEQPSGLFEAEHAGRRAQAGGREAHAKSLLDHHVNQSPYHGAFFIAGNITWI